MKTAAARAVLSHNAASRCENSEVYRFTAQAIVDTTVWIAKRRDLVAGLAKSDIAAANNVRELVTRSLEHVENHQTSLERVATFPLEMDRRLDQPQVIGLPMGRRDIAVYLGNCA